MQHRRDFLQSIGAAGAAASAARPASSSPAPAGASNGRAQTWLFWDHWHLDSLDGATLQYGQALWRPEADYSEPLLQGLGSWPTVMRDPGSGNWRMFYSGRFLPLTLLCAGSNDGYEWRPLPRPDIQPPGGQPKLAPHHLLTLPQGSGGGVYADPLETGGHRYQIFAIQHSDPATERALANPGHLFHEAARTAGSHRYIVDHFTVVSGDGFQWRSALDAVWNKPHWHPEPPVFGFHNAYSGQRSMTSRPGHGDRRVVIQTSDATGEWSGPELLLQPDPSDEPLIQHYGMPVFPYEGQFVGLLWIMHCGDSERLRSFNHFRGKIDCQLAYSFDGLRFQRGARRPFIPLNEPGQPASGSIEPSCLVDAGDELRIYSSSSIPLHGMGSAFRDREEPQFHIVLHTLRRDGFSYLESTGNWGRLLSKPMTLFGPDLTANISAPYGDALFQLTGLDSNPIEGFTFDDCVPFSRNDDLRWKVAWKERNPASLEGQAVRLEIRFRHARIYAVRGKFHFLDAQDWHLLRGGQKIDTRWFDF